MKELKWVTVVEYVDKETGERLTKTEALNNYTVIKTNKHVIKKDITNHQTGWHIKKGYIFLTKICRRTALQGNLFGEQPTSKKRGGR